MLELIDDTSWHAGMVLLTAACAFAIASMPYLLRAFKEASSQKKATTRAAGFRGKSLPDTIRVRQTDITENMSKDDHKVYQKAEELIAAKEFPQAAHLLESIRFQRKAIELLERNGFIDEACEMLVRLNAPQRAAIIAERNLRPERAAYFYTFAGQHDKAGNAYMRLAKKDYRYYETALNSFREAGHRRGVLQCQAAMLETEKVVESCLEADDYEFLAEYMIDPLNARVILAKLDEKQIEKLFRRMPLSPKFVQSVVAWIFYVPNKILYQQAFRLVCEDHTLCELFWRTLPAAVLEPVTEHLCKLVEASGSNTHEIHGTTMEKLGYLEEAAKVWHQMGRNLKSAMCYLQLGDLVRCHDFLRRAGDSKTAAKIAEILQENPRTPWTSQQMEKAKAVLQVAQDQTHEMDFQLCNVRPAA